MDQVARNDGSAAGRVDLFVSYAREDAPFVRRLHEALVAAGRAVWVDWEDIPPTADWRSEIGAGITAAEGFVFVISPDSLASAECARELEYALEQGKRILPVVRREPDGAPAPAELASRNWIFFRDEDDFGGALAALGGALDTDLEWVRAHTRLLVRADEWEWRGRDRSFVLRGSDLRDAEAALAGAAREPEPTPLQREYVLASRRAASRRQRGVLAAVLVALAATAALAVVALLQRDQAIENERTARSRELATSAVTALARDPELGLLLAREAVLLRETPEAVDALRRAVAASHLVAVLRGTSLTVERAGFTPDGTIVVGGGTDGLVRSWDARTGRPLGAVENRARAGLQTGDTPTVFAVAPRGHAVASTGSGGSVVTVWDARDGRELARMRGLQQVHSLAFAPDGRRLAIASGRTGRIWDWRTRKTLHVLRGHRRLVTSVGFDADGTHAVTAGLDGTARVWSARTGDPLGMFPPGGAARRGWAMEDARPNADASLLVTLDAAGVARVWNVAAGTELAAVGGRVGRVADVALDAGGRLLATASEDGSAQVWSVPGGKRVAELGGHEAGLTDLVFDPAGTAVAGSSADGTARVWAARTGVELAVLRGHASSVGGVAFSPDGGRVVTASFDGTARVWRVVGRPLHTLRPHGPALGEVAFAPDGTLYATVGGSEVKLRRAASGRPYARFEEPDQVEAIVFGPGSDYLVTTGFDAVARLWSTRDRKLVRALEPGTRIAQPTRIAADGTHLVAFGSGTTAYVWRVPEGELVAELPGHRPGVMDADVSQDGRLAATVDFDLRARIWDVAGGVVLGRLGGDAADVESVDFGPDGRRIVTTGDGMLRIWEAPDGDLLATTEAPDAGEAWFSPDGATILTTGGSTRLWDGETLRLRAALGQLERDAVFSGDGRFVLTTGDEEVHLWAVDSAARVASFRVPGGVVGADLSGDGTRVVAGNHLGSVYVWACEACRPVDGLLELAGARVTRELTRDERATYLHE